MMMIAMARAVVLLLLLVVARQPRADAASLSIVQQPLLHLNATATGSDDAHGVLAEEEKELIKCDRINRFQSVAEQCQFVREHCSDGENSPGLINYFEFYYCTMGSRDLQWLAAIVLTLQLAFLFVFLGTAASEYFCPNLSTLSESLRLPQDVAGVTFLALGNSAPDLFSSAVALHSADATGLALGSMMGAGLFVGGAVVGVVALTARHGKSSPEHGEPMIVSVEPATFLRDVGFLVVTVMILGGILVDGKMWWWEGLIMLLLYMLYIGVVLVVGWRRRRYRAVSQCDGKWPCSRLASRRNSQQSPVQITIVDSDISDGAFVPPPLNISYLTTDSSKTPSIRSWAVERRQSDAQSSLYRRARPRSRSIHSPASVVNHRVHALQAHRAGSRSLAAALELWSAWRSVESGEQSEDQVETMTDDDEEDLLLPPMSPLERSQSLLQHYRHNHRLPAKQEFRRFVRTICRHLFPIVDSWRGQGFVGRLVAILNVPACIVLGLTIPVVMTSDETSSTAIPAVEDASERSDSDHPHSHHRIEAIEWHYRYILLMQCLVTPLFIAYAAGVWTSNLASEPHYFPGWLVACCVSLVLFCLMAFICGPHRNIRQFAMATHVEAGTTVDKSAVPILLPWRHPVLSFFGFVVGIVWIFLVASEVVGLLKAIGEILVISEAILGITVNAIGNSVGDLVSNVTMARMGYPQMAIAASFAGPLLNLLIVLGVTGLMGVSAAPMPFPLSTNLLLTTTGLLVMQLGNIIVIPACGFKIRRTYAWCLLCAYCVIVGGTVLLSTLDLQIPGLPAND